jgi:hypothetical protein
MDAKSKSDPIKVGNDGADCPHQPNSSWRAWVVETGAYAKGCDRM